jgi:hypothetical protein
LDSKVPGIEFAIDERQGLLYLPSTVESCALSKAVTAKQGLKNGSLVIDKEDIWTYVKEVYWELALEAIARAYSSHPQVASAIADDHGGDAFVREKKALHFRMRVNSVPFYDNEEAKEPSGDEMIHSIDYDGVDTSGNMGLRYKKPDVSGLDMADFLSQQELEALWNNLDEYTAEWLQVSAALLTMEDGEGDNAADVEMEDGEVVMLRASLTMTTTTRWTTDAVVAE